MSEPPDDPPALCGSEPPRELVSPDDGRVWIPGDCWCTLDTFHDGLCFCMPCTTRLGAPGWEKT